MRRAAPAEDDGQDDLAETVSAKTDTPRPGRPARRWFLAAFGLLVLVLVGVGFTALGDDPASGELADVGGQGDTEPLLASNGARLERSLDGLRFEVKVQTPVPGSYEYPTGDMVPKGAPLHPAVTAGGPDQSEVFTLWAFVFNYPDRCIDGECDFDDIGDTEARGGVYQIGGLVADEATLVFSGSVRLGQTPVNGVPLENPAGAEVHIGMAPHGRALEGDALVAQLNSSVGNPTFWWPASFVP